jgi:hypothetical protein
MAYFRDNIKFSKPKNVISNLYERAKIQNFSFIVVTFKIQNYQDCFSKLVYICYKVSVSWDKIRRPLVIVL